MSTKPKGYLLKTHRWTKNVHNGAVTISRVIIVISCPRSFASPLSGKAQIQMSKLYLFPAGELLMMRKAQMQMPKMHDFIN